jgi:hypothetical protein
MDKTPITVLCTAHGQMEAEILKSLLGSAGIEVLLSQEGAGAVLGMTVGPLGDVDVLVRESQLPQARELLEEYLRGSLDRGESDSASAPE